jgi:catechol 2,3-dioxygenase-like lactoylglutathione lyase family enzyme
MAKKGLSHIALKTRDLKKTEDFYVGVLGLKVAFRHPPTMIFLTTPGSGDLLNFIKTGKRSSGSKASNISVSNARQPPSEKWRNSSKNTT